MTTPISGTLTAFAGTRRLASGPAAEVAIALSRYGGDAPILIWRDSTGHEMDLDLRGSEADIRARYAPPSRGRGRPKLGVTPREVTLLPRHWDWLASQRGGASAALRRLVDEARKAEARGDSLPRQRIDAAWQFMTSMAGDLPGFEEASRKLYANDLRGAEALMQEWPKDVVTHIWTLLDYRADG
ncbi:DUF2239 family protein [Pontivivens insulae]|uniref:DUF2239 domain-containing protein n=1 Tax=Pontivivens insulae TaxID=1639689 RepID=A0A2R8ADY9_9RHOB|nr:DUF2239 family protein [Pontivivens insulae]RED14305.1 hypothetical protein DFR53_1662 [Pontivivens insulae]SPF30382.1 hypothetical protein POI8812_02718 [Pontivivens insulae]